jgi:GT2 family glycosyltransferase
VKLRKSIKVNLTVDFMRERELSILITAYKKPELLELCIKSIKENISDEVDYEIIVADSATEESTIDLMKNKFPKITFLPNKKNCGFGSLVNQASKVSKGEYLFIINHDIIIKSNAIQHLLTFIRENKEVGLVGPKLINFDGSIQSSAFRFYDWKTVIYRRTFLGKFSFAKEHLNKFLMKDEIEDGKIIEVDWVMGSAMMVSRKALDTVGGFDSRFFLYFEDVDWCRRFWEKGYKVIYNPTVTVAHYHGKASGNKNALKAVVLNQYTRLHIKSAIKFFLKYLGKPNPHK